MSRKTFYVYRWLNHCWYPDKKIRLFNKHTAKWGGMDPHDKVLVDGSNIKDLRGDILHYTCDSISEHLQQMDKFTEIAAGEIIKNGKTVNLLTPLTHSVWTFVRIYFIRGGLLDGFAGFVVAFLSMVYAFVKYAKVIFKRQMLPAP